VGALVVVLALPALLRPDTATPFGPTITPGELPGLEQVVPLASGGVQSVAVDGDTIWAVTALAHQLQRISASAGAVEATYDIGAYVEGFKVGGGYLWLLSYDNGGEVLRFDPEVGVIDKTIPLGAAPWFGADWVADRLWVSTEDSEIVQINADGEIVATESGELKGEGLGYHWVNDPSTGVISSLDDAGTRGEIVIPTDGSTAPLGSDVREVTEAGGYLWLLDDNFPDGSGVTRFDPATGDILRVPLTRGVLGMAGFDGALWVTSNTDHVLAKLDSASGDATFYALPGKPGGVFEADGSLWVALYHSGSLIRLDTEAELIQRGDVTVDAVDNGHRLVCTGTSEAGQPTVLLEPMEWIDYGSWSVVQAELTSQGYRVCASGYDQAEAGPETRAADLDTALAGAGITGPYVLAANGDGVHAARLFADGRDDVVGIVLVDPTPVGFSTFLNQQLGTDDGDPSNDGHPPWNDLDPAVSDGLADFGDAPLVVIGQDPNATYLSPNFVEFAGEEAATAINDFWQSGLDFYEGLSTNATRTTTAGEADIYILWNDHQLVVDHILDVIARSG
jgi:sugar lactone lactonase YvrE